LRELHDEGLIYFYFFRVRPPYDINASGEDESLRLTSEEVDETLRSDWWRGSEGLPENHPAIWFGPTPAGEAACENPPESTSESCGDSTTGRERWSGRSSSSTGATASRSTSQRRALL
jgi:hypothetical protein